MNIFKLCCGNFLATTLTLSFIYLFGRIVERSNCIRFVLSNPKEETSNVEAVDLLGNLRVECASDLIFLLKAPYCPDFFGDLFVRCEVMFFLCVVHWFDLLSCHQTAHKGGAL